MSRRVTVVGAGVVGLTVAHELVAAGDTVTVVADVDTSETVSAVAAALWFPYRSERSDGADELLRASLARFTALAGDPDVPVDLRAGTLIERTDVPDRSWTTTVPDWTESEVVPDGAAGAIRATLPMIDMPRYLPWLRAQLDRHGVAVERRTVDSPDDLAGAADLVVVCAGLRGGELLGDDTSAEPVAGQVVRLANPGLTEWLLDEDNPDGMVYVLPRRDDVVVGGTAVVGSADATVDPATEARMLERAERLVPDLVGQPIVGRAAGLRPARPSIRLERVEGRSVETIAAYGHGGAGVTLSWSTAARVAELVHGR